MNWLQIIGYAGLWLVGFFVILHLSFLPRWIGTRVLIGYFGGWAWIIAGLAFACWHAWRYFHG